MQKNIINLITLRYFFSKKRTGLISFTSWISIIGVGLGGFALMFTLSVLNGFEQEIQNRLIDFESHINITGDKLTQSDLELIKDSLDPKAIKSILPSVTNKAILTTSYKDAVVKIKSINSVSRENMFHRESIIIRGSNSFETSISDLPGIILGYRLVDQMALYIGDTVNVVNPLKIGSTFNIPFVGKFILTGVFRLDLFDYDDNVAFIDIKDGQRIFNKPDEFTEINIKLTDYKLHKYIIPELEKIQNKNYNFHTWEDLHKTLFGAMQLEKYGSFAALCFIILVAVFNLTSSLVMLVMEKIREIGMLQALGMNRSQLRLIFLRLGILTGSIGLITGLSISILISLLQQHYKFIPLPSVYFIPYLPVQVQGLDIILILFTGLLMIIFGVIYPAWKVSKLMPLEAIQYEK